MASAIVTQPAPDDKGPRNAAIMIRLDPELHEMRAASLLCFSSRRA
jgi:hypothetical protein